MSWLTVLVIALALVTLATWAYFFHARDAFWELAAKYADLAIALIALERDCVVGNMPPDGRKRDWATRRRQRIGLHAVNPRSPAGIAVLLRHYLGRGLAAFRGWRG